MLSVLQIKTHLIVDVFLYSLECAFCNYRLSIRVIEVRN